MGSPSSPSIPSPGQPEQDLPLPLDGMRIVGISPFVAAPLGGMNVAQLRAEVIRIDPIGGPG
jgi:crotonobetainyl-CoA:carnitine CoA-transferase CaiB-like acyl-CoA transferase